MRKFVSSNSVFAAATPNKVSCCLLGNMLHQNSRFVGSYGNTYNKPSPSSMGGGGEGISPQSVLQDLRENTGPDGKIQMNRCDPRDIPTNELGHMESPVVDEAQKVKLDDKVGDLFSRLPTPEDPMKAALMPTAEELKDRDDYDAFKEALREKYLRSKSRAYNETKRLEEAMSRVAKGTYEPSPMVEARAEKKRAEELAAKHEAEMKAQKEKDDEIKSLQGQLLEMQKKMRAMELEKEREAKRAKAQAKKEELESLETDNKITPENCFDDADLGDLNDEFEQLVKTKNE